jgi:hypothetical protein
MESKGSVCFILLPMVRDFLSWNRREEGENSGSTRVAQRGLYRLKATAVRGSCLIQGLATPLQSGEYQRAESHLRSLCSSCVTLGKSRLLSGYLFAHL